MKKSKTEELCGTRRADPIPDWARGTEARLVGEDRRRAAWDLYRGDKLIGSMYDIGDGLTFEAGCAIADGDWAKADVPWDGDGWVPA